MLTQCPACRTVFRVAPAQLTGAAGRVRCGQCHSIFLALEDEGVDSEPETILAWDEADLDEEPADPAADSAEHELLNVEIESTPSIEITMEGERIAIDGEEWEAFQSEGNDVEPPSPATSGERNEAAPPETGSFVLGQSLPVALQAQPPRRMAWAWIVGSALLLVALIAQLIHSNRDSLAGAPYAGAVVKRLYAAFGIELSAPGDLRAYELRQWGAAADPDGSGQLRVRASVFNNSDRPQPCPVLRLTLHDRFGSQVGARDVRPQDYLPDARKQMLHPGERIDAQIAVADPGTEAVSFELDACLQQNDAEIVCANSTGS